MFLKTLALNIFSVNYLNVIFAFQLKDNYLIQYKYGKL